LTELFKQTPREFITSARDCAEVSYAMLIGLRSAVYFDDDIELVDAHRLFKNTMSSMAGF